MSLPFLRDTALSMLASQQRIQALDERHLEGDGHLVTNENAPGLID
jgi:hypothetical protein